MKIEEHMSLSMCNRCLHCIYSSPDNKVNGANMEPIWGRLDPGGPHVGPMNFAIWVDFDAGSMDMLWNANYEYIISEMVKTFMIRSFCSSYFILYNLAVIFSAEVFSVFTNRT